MATNYATTLADRPLFADKTAGDVPSWFRHISPTPPTTPPAFPEYLNEWEQAEVQTYLNNPTDEVLATLKLPAAISKANAFKTWYALPATKAYLDADRMARIAQWKIFVADSITANLGTTSASGDSGGIGSTPPGDVVPPGHEVP
jgi:hypothetical protein